MRLLAPAPVLAILAILAPAGASAQSNRWERQVRDQLQRAIVALADGSGGRGKEPRSELSRIGTLNTEESEAFTLTLQAGVDYAMIGVCDQDCAGLQLVLSTASGNEIAADRRSETFPVLRFTPRETMRYRVKVTMAACQMSPCWYGAAVYRK